MTKDSVATGLICVMSTLEPCYSYKVIGNRATEKLEIKSYYTKCLHLYHYWNDPIFGLVHGRIQTWYPFNLQFYVNGKEFLKCQMDSKGISYTKTDNCFTWVSDYEKANVLAGKQVEFNWQKKFDEWALRMNPLLNEIFPMDIGYYWTLAQSEWASDILFKSPDVMKFLGKRLTIEDQIHGGFSGEVITDYKNRPEGARIKHSVNTNSVKIYDKAGSVLRIETTINKPNEFKSHRPKLSTGELEWQPMRKSIDDIPRRAEVSQSINNRHLTALTSANTGEKFKTLIDSITSPVIKDQVKVRGLDPLFKDRIVLDAIIDGKFHIGGFRNKDLRVNLFGVQNPEQEKRNSSKISRILRILRTHGIIKKIPRTHRYMMTDKGIELISALRTVENTNVSDLIKLAA